MVKNREDKKWILSLALTALLTVFLFESVSAFGVGAQACDIENCYSLSLGALQIQPGDSREVFAVLQNNAGGEDITLKAEITQGREFATLVDGDQYTVPFGNVNYKVKIRVSVPENYQNDFNVGVKFTAISSGEEQTVTFSPAIGFLFPVHPNANAKSPSDDIDVIPVDETNKNEKEEGRSMPWVVLLVVLVLSLAVIIVYFTLANKRRKLAFPDGASF